MNTSSSSVGGDEVKKTSPWNGFLMGFVVCLIVRDVSRNYQSWINRPPATVPVHSAVNRSHATLAYWNTTVRNLHEVRFKVTPSERPSEQVWNEFVSQLKVLSDQANVAPWDNVDQDLVSMVIRHSFIDGKVFQFKTQMDEWRKQNPASPENSVSLNEAMAQWQQIMARRSNGRRNSKQAARRAYTKVRPVRGGV